MNIGDPYPVGVYAAAFCEFTDDVSALVRAAQELERVANRVQLSEADSREVEVCRDKQHAANLKLLQSYNRAITVLQKHDLPVK